MAVIIDFNSYRTKREQEKKQEQKAVNGQKVLNEQEEKRKRNLERAKERWVNMGWRENMEWSDRYPLLAEALIVYEEAGFMTIGDKRYKFSEFVRNAKLGEFSEGCQKTGYRCSFAFKCGSEWYYVIVSATGINYDKRTFARENNLNLVSIDIRSFIRKLQMESKDIRLDAMKVYYHIYEIIGKKNSETALVSKSRSTAEMQ